MGKRQQTKFSKDLDKVVEANTDLTYPEAVGILQLKIHELIAQAHQKVAWRNKMKGHTSSEENN